MTTLAQQAWLDQEDQLTADTVRRYGWRIIYVLAEGGSGPDCAAGCPCQQAGTGPTSGPAFAYTVGLFGLGHPELLIFDVSPEVAGRVLNELGREVRAGANLLPRRVIELSSWDRRVVTEQVPIPGAIVYAANSFYRKIGDESVPVLQLSYDDLTGRFPWEAGYDDRAGEQPRPGTVLA